MNSMVIARSRKLLVYLIIIHSVMLVTLLSLLVISWWSLFVSAILLTSFIYYAQQYQWLKPRKSVVSINYHADKGWSLHYSDESVRSGLSLMSSFVTPQLVILYFNHRYFWQRDVVTIMDDSVDAQLFRQLRVYLKSPKTFQK
jgi:toxin CptA